MSSSATSGLLLRMRGVHSRVCSRPSAFTSRRDTTLNLKMIPFLTIRAVVCKYTSTISHSFFFYINSMFCFFEFLYTHGSLQNTLFNIKTGMDALVLKQMHLAMQNGSNTLVLHMKKTKIR